MWEYISLVHGIHNVYAFKTKFPQIASERINYGWQVDMDAFGIKSLCVFCPLYFVNSTVFHNVKHDLVDLTAI